jgi:hypothetical protein
MSEDNKDTTGYVSSSEYARLNNLIEFKVIKELTNGTLEGRVIGTSWYVKDGAGKTAEEITVEKRRAGLSASAPSQNEYNTSINPVKIVGLKIPFEDVLMVSFQFAVAGIILAIPIALLLVVITS